MREWKVPGLAIAVVQHQQVIYSHGFGLRDVRRNVPVTTKTLFAIGSITKSFTSLSMGILNNEGKLDHVGFTATLHDLDREALTPQLEALIMPPGFTGNAPGGPSRWSTERSGEWQPLRPERVVEVRYDHVSGGRFRHGTRLVRWRPDKAPRQCTFEQIEASPTAHYAPATGGNGRGRRFSPIAT